MERPQPDPEQGSTIPGKCLPPPLYPLHMPRYINDIIIHCSDTPAGSDFGVSDIRAWHTAPPPRGNGWKDIGYHYVIRLDGSIETGRYISQAGAHCRGHNAHSIGICYIGGRDEHGRTADTRTAEQKAALLKLITRLLLVYDCPVHGHHDYDKAKDCPCFDAAAEYGNIRKQLHEKYKIC